MGHTRLGELPKSRKWSEVAALFAQEFIATPQERDLTHEAVLRTMNAATEALTAAIKDPGLQYSFYLLAQVAVSSKQGLDPKRLESLGIDTTAQPSPFGLVSSFQNAIDNYLTSKRHSSDISEIAQKAAGEALLVAAKSGSANLFEAETETLSRSIKSVSSKNGFAELGHQFFSSFLTRFLNFYLSRATAKSVNKGTIEGLQEVSRFNDALELHCRQTTRIVRDFCGEWYSKTAYEEGIDVRNSARFIAVALKKLNAEVERQRSGK